MLLILFRDKHPVFLNMIACYKMLYNENTIRDCCALFYSRLQYYRMLYKCMYMFALGPRESIEDFK